MNREHRLLILTPFGKDANHLSQVLTAESFICVICTDPSQLSLHLKEGAGAILTTEEILSSPKSKILVEALQEQPPWSAVPVLAFYSEGVSINALSKKTEHPLYSLTDVTFLARPVAGATLFSAVKNALRDRGRQYKIRDLLVRQEEDIQQKQFYAEQQKIARVLSEQAKTAALEASRLKSQFLANMSHEIRTPLGAITGFLGLIKSPETSREEVVEYVSVVERNSYQLMRLIDDILDLSKVEAGKMEIERVEFSLGELLFDFDALMSVKAREKGILFELHLETSVPARIISDPTRLGQILTNAVGNAIKFTDRGRVQLLCSYQSDVLEFVVTDTGRGISEAQAQKLFQAFAQADSSTTRQFGGTGLGLVLTKRICQQMGGDYRLESSSIGRGSRFVATVMAEAMAGTAMLGKSHRPTISGEIAFEAAEKIFDQMRILLVEDSLDNQMLFKIFLRKWGVDVDIASNGQEGVELATKNPYDLILMDVQMPVMDGHEATRQLRRLGCKLPIIALTAHAMAEERQKTTESGFTDFLSKPLRREALADVLSRHWTMA